MPDNEFPKIKTHPFRLSQIRQAELKQARAKLPAENTPKRPTPTPTPQTPYAELAVTSNYTFLTGASHPEEFVHRAAELGHAAAAVADTNTLAGVVRAHVAAKEAGIPLAVGTRLVLDSGLAILAFASDRASYSRLSGLLTLGKRRAPKGECHLTLHDVLDHHQGVLPVVMPPRVLDDDFIATMQGLKARFGERLSLAATRDYRPDDNERLAQLVSLAEHVGVPLAATNDAHYHDPGRRMLQDVVTCIRHGCTIEAAGYRLHPNAERHIKSPEEMARLFREAPGAVQRAADIALRAAAFSMDELRYQYPSEACPPGMTPAAYLRQETSAGARRRYPQGVPEKVTRTIEHELSLIKELGYEAYFLTCYDIVNFARARGILCQGRGGAANSAVCYCLGITEVDPDTHHLLFERFISRSRGEPPDIDIDFEHERREEVIQYLYQKYGRDRAALTAEVITYRGRSAVREVGKAMGLSLDGVDALAKNLDRWGDDANEARVREAGFDPADPTIAHVMRLTHQLIGFPRHLSQHVGGFVITQTPLHELVPIENAAMEDRTVIEWDKDDIDAMGMLKVDCLGLGMLTCVRKALELLLGYEDTYPAFARLASDPTDRAVYDMICRADTLGVFQIESRAQMSMLPRLKPRCFYDLVIEVAIVRPGPIQGDMVHPYLRRREGAEPVNYPSDAVRDVLERTLGVPLFQEQAMQLAIVAAGFTPDQADALRKAMAAWKRKGDAIYRFGQQLVDGMLANGYPRSFAERCFEQIKGFSEYGFPESHAASFAILVWVSCWLKRYEPAAFAAALINSQPMGFYQPAQIIRDAREHGVQVRPVDVNASAWDCTLEESDEATERRGDGGGREAPPHTWGLGGPAIRLGMRLVKGMVQADAHRIAAAVERCGPFTTIEGLWRASEASVRSLRALANADAFGSMGLDRQRALWQIKPLRDDPLPLFDGLVRQADPSEDALDRLPAIPQDRHVLEDYASLGLSLKAHPISFLRPTLDGMGATPAHTLRDERACPRGAKVCVAGLVLMRQRPSTASGVVFITLEDETGIANLILWSDTFERYRRPARLSRVMLAHGHIERQGEVVHLHAKRIESLDDRMADLVARSRDFH